MCRQPENRRRHMECACYFDEAPLARTSRGSVAPPVMVSLRMLNRAGRHAIAVVAERSVVRVSCVLSVVRAVPLLSKLRLRLCR